MHGSFHIPGWSGRAARAGGAIECGRCGYSLHGLRDAGRCPECGAPVASRTQSFIAGGTLTEAPMAYLRVLVRGCWCLMAGLVLSVVPAVLLVLRTATNFASLGLVAGFVLWSIGLWIITRPREFSHATSAAPSREWSRVRWGARIGQLGLLLGFVLATPALAIHASAQAAYRATVAVQGLPLGATPPPPPMPLVAQVLLGLAGLAVIAGAASPILLGIYMARLADWAQDLDLGARLRLAAGALVAGPVLAIVFLWLLPLTGIPWLIFLGLPFGWLGVAAFLLCIAQYVWGTIQFVNMGRWAIKNASTYLDAQEAISARKAALLGSLAHVPPSASPDPGDVMPSLNQSAPPASRPSLGKHVIRPRDNVQPLELADDQPPVRRHEKGR